METTKINIVKIAKALSDRTRINILSAILKEKSITCNEVTKIAGLSQPTVSHHLKVLHDSGLLNSVKEGKYSNLSINKETFKKFNLMISAFTKV